MHASPKQASRARRRRRGTAYVMMLGMSLMIVVIGLSALYATRSTVRAASMATDADEARTMAQSALEIAQQWIANDPNWRSTRPHGIWVSN